MYDEVEYWNRRVDPNYKAAKSKKIDDNYSFLKKNLNSSKRILIYGPGTGRDIQIFNSDFSAELFFVDITDNYKDSLKKEVDKLPKLKFSKFIKSDKPQTYLDFPDSFFDLCISSQVFLHQKPGYIGENILELYRVSKRVLITSFYDKQTPFDLPQKKYSGLASHCFNHNYPDIIKEVGIPPKLFSFRINEDQIYINIWKLNE